LFAAFVGLSGIDSIDILYSRCIVRLFVGGNDSFIFSAIVYALLWGRAAMEHGERSFVRQFQKRIPGNHGNNKAKRN